MDIELNNALAELITKITNTGDFIVEQAPDVIQQLLQWNFALSIAQNVLALAMFLALVFWTRAIRKERKIRLELGDVFLFDEYGAISDKDFIQLFATLVGYPSAIIGICHLVNLAFLKILISPKLYLIEYAANLIN